MCDTDPPGYKETDDHPYYIEKPPLDGPTVYAGKPPSARSRQAWGEKGDPGEKDTPQGPGPGGEGTPGEDENHSWRQFTRNTTFHGVKYIFDGSSLIRRWVDKQCDFKERLTLEVMQKGNHFLNESYWMLIWIKMWQSLRLANLQVKQVGEAICFTTTKHDVSLTYCTSSTWRFTRRYQDQTSDVTSDVTSGCL